MTEALTTDPYELNKFVQKAAFNKEPVFASYKDLCRIQNIEYVDFEWKYYQFYRGNQDFTIKKSPDNSSPLSFSDLPIDVLEKVVGKLTLVDCLLLRKVSHDLRNLVDSSEINCKDIRFDFCRNYAQINFEKFTSIYGESSDGCCSVTLFRDYSRIKEYKDSRNFQKVMIADASTFLKNPKLKIGRLSYYVYGNGADSEVIEFLKSLNIQLNVSSIDIEEFDKSILPILKSLKPNTLKKISVNWSLCASDDIAETEQWKMAKEVGFRGYPTGFRMDKVLHFKKININRFECTDQNVIMIRDVLLKSAHLELGLFGIRSSSIMFLGQRRFRHPNHPAEKDEDIIERIMRQDPAYDAETGRFSIPNSRDYFQLKIDKEVFPSRWVIARKNMDN